MKDSYDRVARPRTILITGASGFIGSSLTKRLVDRDIIRSLTAHPAKNRFGERVTSYPYDFAEPSKMSDAFRDVDVFINTYYVRFNYGDETFERAVANSRVLVECARKAGVRRLVHVSVSNASEEAEAEAEADVDLPYYRNKGRIERIVRESGLDYVILRPAIVFGEGDILLNNIAFFLRRFPVFGVFGRGDYRVQPIDRNAFGALIVDAIESANTGAIMNVAGPEDYTYAEVVRLIKRSVGSRAALVPIPIWTALAVLKVTSPILRDVVLTRDEIDGLVREYLYTETPVRAGMSLRSWLSLPAVRNSLGMRYRSELELHFR